MHSTSHSFPTTIPAFLWHFIRKQKWKFYVLFASTIAHVFESNILPYALKMMVDTVTRIGDKAANAGNELMTPVVLFIVTWVVMIVIWRVQEWISAFVLPQFQTDIRMGMFAYVQQHSHSFFSDHFAGSIAGKINDMPRAADSMIGFIRWRLLTTAWVTLFAIVLLATVSYGFSLVLLAWVMVHMGISYYFSGKVSHYSALHAEDMNVLKGHIVDGITNSSTVRLFARHGYEQSYVAASQSIEQASNHKVAITMLKVRAIIDVPLILMYVATLLLLVKGWHAGWVSAGDIVLVMFTVFNVMGLVWLLGTELPNLFNEIGIAKQALTLINRPHGVVDAPDAKPLSLTRGEIVFDNVSFHYRKGRNIFSDKSLTIAGGQKVGLVGFSGSGKTTFVNLILRFFDVEQGRILIDGQDIARVTQDSLRAQIAMIPQDTTLFHRTLMENIRYGRLEASDEEVIDVAKRAHCHEFITHIEEGYGALVGERGIKLSGGQRQRIAIARAMLKNAPILILDEATSSLDSVTEKTIKESLSALMQGRTCIVIAHRLSTLADMDRILVFREGRIAEDGTHAALLAAGGHYARLWNMQAGGFLPEDEE